MARALGCDASSDEAASEVEDSDEEPAPADARALMHAAPDAAAAAQAGLQGAVALPQLDGAYDPDWSAREADHTCLRLRGGGMTRPGRMARARVRGFTGAAEGGVEPSDAPATRMPADPTEALQPAGAMRAESESDAQQGGASPRPVGGRLQALLTGLVRAGSRPFRRAPLPDAVPRQSTSVPQTPAGDAAEQRKSSRRGRGKRKSVSGIS